jgi:hypothetical protein
MHLINTKIPSPMNLDYEVYNGYNPKAMTEITVSDFLQNTLVRLEQMFEFLQQSSKELVGPFSTGLIEALSSQVNQKDIDQFLNECSVALEAHPLWNTLHKLSSFIFRFMLEQLDLSNIVDGKANVFFLNAEKSENLISYMMISQLVKLAGRDSGIELWKGYVEYKAKHAPPREPTKFKDMRDSMLANMNESGGFAFTIHDFDENMFVGRFDKCVVYDSLKDQDDPELAYYATCYSGMVIGNRRDWCLRMRRTQTLFSGDYCDELYWNREVYDEPEQPSLELTRRMVIE